MTAWRMAAASAASAARHRSGGDIAARRCWRASARLFPRLRRPISTPAILSACRLAYRRYIASRNLIKRARASISIILTRLTALYAPGLPHSLSSVQQTRLGMTSTTAEELKRSLKRSKVTSRQHHQRIDGGIFSGKSHHRGKHGSAYRRGENNAQRGIA